MINVNLLIGDKSPIYKKNQAGTGEGRHHEPAFFNLLEGKVTFNQVPMYQSKLPFCPKLNHILHHFLHPFTLRKKLNRQAITHIMFGEEASLLKFIKPSKTTIVTCLDLIPLIRPEGLNRWNARFLSWCTKGIRHADHIVTNSEFTKKEIIKYLKIPKTKISVIYPPISEQFKPVDHIPSTFFKKYSLSQRKKYLLYVGAIDLPRKNVKTLISAFAQIQSHHPDLELLIVGHSYNSERLSILKENAKSLPIRFFQDPNHQDLLYFYNLATIFVFPSLYEGFGLPPAEAMACGTPVITSNSASLPEVVGDAGITVDCTSPKKLADKISSTIIHHELLKKLRQCGLIQSKKFSWDQHMKKHYELYKRLSSS